MSKKRIDPIESVEVPTTTSIKETELFKQLKESQRVLELIKTQFGYSGYSHPNYIAVDKTITENKKILDGIK